MRERTNARPCAAAPVPNTLRHEAAGEIERLRIFSNLLQERGTEHYKWRCIETAPHDGTRILLRRDGNTITAGHWNGKFWQGWPGANHPPTYWMPIAPLLQPAASVTPNAPPPSASNKESSTTAQERGRDE